MFSNNEENISSLLKNIIEAKEILKQAEEATENFFIELPALKTIHTNQLDKESIVSFLCKLDNILTPSQINELEPIFVTFIEIISYKSFKQGVRLGIENKPIVRN